MKKIIIISLVLVIFAGLGVAAAFLLQTNQPANQNKSVVSQNNQSSNSGQEVAPEKNDETEESSAVTLEKIVEVTPDDKYSYGAFCRVGYIKANDEFLVTFGGANRDVQMEYSDPGSQPGGAEGGNGYSYKYYSADDFEYTGKNGIVINAGGDTASVTVDDAYYYILSGRVPEVRTSDDWMITKFDASTMEQVDQVGIKLDLSTEVTSDQMLAYANGYLIASSLYNPGGNANKSTSATTAPKEDVESEKDNGTHNHLFTTDLDSVNSFHLTDTAHSNGGYVVYVDGIYNYITSTAFHGELIVMQYDDNWKYLGVKELDVSGTWAQGAVYDEDTQRFYVPYVGLEKKETGGGYGVLGIELGIYDKDWNNIETIEVSVPPMKDATKEFRPSIIEHNGKLYVSYDSTTLGENGGEEMNWQCLVNIYDLNQ